MIISLPITVRETAPLGYWLTPVLTDAIAKHLGEEGRVFTGKIGLRSPDERLEERFSSNLDFLSVKSNRESDTDYLSLLLEEASQALINHQPRVKDQLCHVCPCERLQLPVEIATFAKEKTFRREGTEFVCKTCGQGAILQQVSSGFFTLKEHLSLASVRVFPRAYESEVSELLRQLKSQGVPAVRQRETGLVYRGSHLDTEFVWQFLPLILFRQYPKERVRILITNHVLRQAVTAVSIAKLINPLFEADLIVTPCIVHPGSSEKWSLERLRELGYTGPLLRAMLIGSLGWRDKDAALYDSLSSIELRRFTLFRERVLNDSRAQTHQSLQNMMGCLAQQNIARGMKHVFNPSNFDYQSLTGLF